MDYNIIVGEGDDALLIEWGHHKGWIQEYRERLDSAKRLTLVPKLGVRLPTVSVSLEPNQRWIVVAKVVKQQRGPNAHKPPRKIYGVGWQETIKGVNVKNITWVYPSGEIENAPAPSFIDETIAA